MKIRSTTGKWRLALAGVAMAWITTAQASDFALDVNNSNTFDVASSPLGGIAGCNMLLGTHNYASQTIQTGSAATYTFTATAAGTSLSDPFLAVYSPAFDPANPTENLIACNDDTNGLLPEFSAPLEAGTPYVLVATTWQAADLSGTVAFSSSPDITLIDAPPAPAAAPIPTLSEWALLIMSSLIAIGAWLGFRNRAV